MEDMPMGKKKEIDYALSPVTEVYKLHTELMEAENADAATMLTDGVRLLLDIKKENKELEAAKEEATRFFKAQYDAEKAPYDTLLKIHAKLLLMLKTRLLDAYTSSEVIVTPGGTIAFSTSWEGAITDPGAVPMEYWSVDRQKVQEAVDNGLMNIPGISIEKRRTVIVRARGEE
jgi:hypothetical protein